MKYFVVKKLDEADSQKVAGLLSRVSKIATAIGWEHATKPELAELLIVIGGDGTMLHAMSIAAKSKAKVVGFNIGKIGFLAEFDPEKIEEAIVNIFISNTTTDIRCSIGETTFGDMAINEFVIAPCLSKDTLKYEFFIDGVSSGAHFANGLIISTPTGSTAYSLSVGGALIQPNAPVFQISPIAPMSMNTRSVIVSDQSKISVKIKLRHGVKYNLIADGQVIRNFEGHDETLKYQIFNFQKQVDNNITLLHGVDWNFFHVLKEKLHWSTEI